MIENGKENKSSCCRSNQNIEKLTSSNNSSNINDKRKSSNGQTSPPKPVRKIDSLNMKTNSSPKVQTKSTRQDAQQHFIQRNNHVNVQKSVQPNFSPTLHQKQISRVQISGGGGSGHSSPSTPRHSRGAIATAKHPQVLPVSL